MALSDEEKAERHRVYMRGWKKRNKEKVNAINRAVKEKNPEKYKTINRVSARKMRAEDPVRFRDINKKYREAHPELCKERTLAWLEKHPGYFMLKNAFHRAKVKGLPFDITLDDIVVPEVCPVLGIKIANYKGMGRGGFKDDAPSLDKIIPSKGYVKGNVRVISNRANAIKRDASLAELKAVTNYVEHEMGLAYLREKRALDGKT